VLYALLQHFLAEVGTRYCHHVTTPIVTQQQKEERFTAIKGHWKMTENSLAHFTAEQLWLTIS